MSTTEMTAPAQPARRGRWIDHWEPEDPGFWEKTGKRVASRNLWFSVLAEHIGFSMWTIWSVLVLFMGPAYGIDSAGKFFLVSLPSLIGGLIRIPYTMAPARFGGGNWTVVSVLLLLIPAVAAIIVMHPGTSYTTFVIVAVLGGLGGGNFASSMVNINAYFPEGRKGWALGLNAGGGNIGVPVVQLLGLAVIATAGAGHPRLVLAIYVPLILVTAFAAARYMDNISSLSNDTGALRAAVREVQTWVVAFLYIGSFGSFIGYSFAFGLVLQTQFHRTPLQTAAVVFIGPLIGSLIRPVGGSLADRFGGAKVTFCDFFGMATATGVVIIASTQKSLPLFMAGFIALFVLSGIGNGSTFKMIPSIFNVKARVAIASGEPKQSALMNARRLSGAVIGIAGAIGAMGGLLINLAFRESFLTTKSGIPAFWSFLIVYAVCILVTYVAYLRRAPVAVRSEQVQPAYAQV
ncbi:MAG: NarK/NasA family nitrate transporter [Pseudonocardiales bacterium]|nr:NarK/NasA family nitrate transporter [Pseudonocardiales bacterium]MBV9031550.1 NarK/NasA family nitrate transporter [Pseudonocardiales bacterium]